MDSLDRAQVHNHRAMVHNHPISNKFQFGHDCFSDWRSMIDVMFV